MGRGPRYRTRRGKSEDQYFGLFYAMARSLAFRSLSGAALKVFLEVRTRFNGCNNGDLSLSLDEAARLLGIGKGTAQRALAELTEKGFIAMTKKGQWYGRRASCVGRLARARVVVRSAARSSPMYLSRVPWLPKTA